MKFTHVSRDISSPDPLRPRVGPPAQVLAHALNVRQFLRPNCLPKRHSTSLIVRGATITACHKGWQVTAGGLARWLSSLRGTQRLPVRRLRSRATVHRRLRILGFEVITAEHPLSQARDSYFEIDVRALWKSLVNSV